MDNIIIRVVPPKDHPRSGDVLLCKKTYSHLDGLTIHDSDMDMGIKGLLKFGVSNQMNTEIYDHVFLYEVKGTRNVEIGDWILLNKEPILITNDNIDVVSNYHKIIKTNDINIVNYNDSRDLVDLEFNSLEMINIINDYNNKILESYI